MASTEDTWPYLPAEVLIEVFLYLPLKWRARVAQTCKWWREVINYPAMWRAISFHWRPGMSTFIFKSILGQPRFRGVEDLSLCGCNRLTEDVFEWMAPLVPKLTTLNVERTAIRNAGMRALVAHCPALTSLNAAATNITVEGLEGLQNRLTRLNLRGTPSSVPRSMEKLTWLNVGNTLTTNFQAKVEGLVGSIMTQRALTFLDISITNMDVDEISAITYVLPNLKILKMNEMLMPGNFYDIIAKSTSLEEVYVRQGRPTYEWRIMFQRLEQEEFPRTLQLLDLTGCEKHYGTQVTRIAMAHPTVRIVLGVVTLNTETTQLFRYPPTQGKFD